MNLAHAEQRAGDYVAAEAGFQRVIELIEASGRMTSPRLARAYAGLGVSYHAARRFDLAVFHETSPRTILDIKFRTSPSPKLTLSPLIKCPLKFVHSDSEMPVFPRTLEVHNDHPFMIGTMLSWEDGAPLHYDFRSPLNRPVKDLMTAPFEVIATRMITEEEINHDMATERKLINLGINLLLAMTAEPELVTAEMMIRPANIHNGVIHKRALWSPRFLGKNYRIEYEPCMANGTHRSPHAHWRIGHWRNQRHGPQNTLSKRIWIRPVFVGLKQEK